MKALPMTARENNLRRKHDQPVKCSRCGDTGFVCVELRPQTCRRIVVDRNGKPTEKTTTGKFPAYAPCPFCLQGFVEEFGSLDPAAADGDATKIKTPWGPKGFWRNREVAVIRDDG